VVLVETPLPWPKPALDHPHLQGLASQLGHSTVPIRLLAAQPWSGGPETEIVVFDRAGGGATERRYRVEGPEQLADLGRALLDPTLADHRALIGGPDPAGDALLLCTQGSHDVCCGSEGTRLATALSEEWPELVVYQVSHTGGHRFAPTAMTLPGGRMWADLDLDRVRQIMAATGDPEALAARCRGWWGAEQGAAQVAERAVFAAVGWSLDQRTRSVSALDGDSGRYLVEAAGMRWQVDVAEGRQVPTIACRQPGGLPAKPAREYEAVSVESQRAPH
jgi:hypothetical protein